MSKVISNSPVIFLVKFIKRSMALLITLFLLGVVVFNARLYYQPSFTNYGSQSLNQGLIEQLAHLKEELHGGAATDMQGIYPEGYVFLNALYGLSWMEIADVADPESEISKEAYKEIDWVLSELKSPEALRPFDPSLHLPYGIFYQGWYNYLLGRKLNALPEADRDSIEVDQYDQNITTMLRSMATHSSPYLESYKGACWPADMFVAMASVALYNNISNSKYEPEISSWIKTLDTKTDKLGLVPHSCDCVNGNVKESARGSSQSLIQVFLRDIDPVYADQKFKIYKEYFLDKRLGLPGVREYPKGNEGRGDIDSGPVIWGIGGAASIVGQRAFALAGEDEIAIGLRNSIEAFGLGKSSERKKNYLFGALAIADAFIAWGNATEAAQGDALKTDTAWRTKTQLLSLLLIVLGGIGIFFLWRKKS